MEITEQRFEDASEPNSDGTYDYYYSGTNFRFAFADHEFRARRYDDSPGEAAIFADSRRQAFRSIPYDDADFFAVAKYLRDIVGADSIKAFLSEGYVPVDFSRFAVAHSVSKSAETLHCLKCRALIAEGNERCPACGWTWI